MRRLIKDGEIIECTRTFLPKDSVIEDVSDAVQPIVPLPLWLTHKTELASKATNAVWLDSDEMPESLADDLDQLALIAINFPVFTDGRGFSIARLLRERLNYKGEIRAVGHVIQDQMHFLMRCGFNAMDLREGSDLESALHSLADFSEHYQAAVIQPKPLFQRRN